MNHLGLHIYDQNSDISWLEEVLIFNLISALSWKKYMGPIHLYCNTRYLNTLRKWNLHLVYDYINTDILDNKPNEIDYSQYWAFCKLLVMNEVKPPFTQVDTDLYLRLPIKLDDDIIMFHEENFSLDFHRNIYIEPDLLVPNEIKEMNFDKSVLPTNTALLHIKDNSFINEWVELSKEIAVYNKDVKIENPSIKMCFVEQRLLPMILKKKNLNYSLILKSIFQSHEIEAQNGSEWIPNPFELKNSDPNEFKIFDGIKHLWGIKKMFHIPNIRNLIMSICLDDLLQYNIDYKPYGKLFIKLKKKYKNTKRGIR